MLGVFAAIYENQSFYLPWVPNSRAGKLSAVSFEFFFVCLGCQGILVLGTVLAKARAISPANSGVKSVTCYNCCQELLARRDRPALGVKGAQEECPSDRGKKALLGMGMPEATPLQRLPVARGACSIVVSRSWHDKLLNKPAGAPSISLSLEQFSSEPRERHAAVRGKQKERGSEAQRLRGRASGHQHNLQHSLTWTVGQLWNLLGRHEQN